MRSWSLWLFVMLGLLAASDALAQGSQASDVAARTAEVGVHHVSAKTLGNPGEDLIYTPVTPCRVIDTRFAAAGPLAPGALRNFMVAGTTGFPAQGGQNGGCGIPRGPATAVMFNFVAVAPAGDGNLRAWAWATPTPPAPNASIINYGRVNIANGVAVPICTAGAGCNSDLIVRADVSGAHLVVDVLGYFARFPKEAAKILHSEAAFPQDTTVQGGCETLTRIIGIQVPGPGRIVVAATVQVAFSHLNTSATEPIVGIVPFPAPGPNCFDPGTPTSYELDRAMPNGDNYLVTLYPTYSAFVAAAGTYLYTIAADHFGESATESVVQNVHLRATFFPN